MDIFEQAKRKISASLIQSLFPDADAEIRGDEYLIKSPLRPDQSVGSFSINLNTGFWFEFSGDDKGDLIDLIARTRNIQKKEAAEVIIRESGGVVHTKNVKKNKKKAAPPAVYPIPENKETEKSLVAKLKEKFAVETWGKIKKIYKYRDKDDNWIFCTCRFEKEREGKKPLKNVIPFYFTGKYWHAKAPENIKKYPLFGIEKIFKNPSLPIIIVEGEKSAQCEVPGYVLLSWFGGSITTRIKRSDWSYLKNREVFIWPDLDKQYDKQGNLQPMEKQPGMKAALAIKDFLPDAKILDVYNYELFQSKKSGYDIDDCIQDKIDPLEVIKSCIEIEINEEEFADPIEIAKQFINENYGINCLDQFNGNFMFYDRDYHYWKQISKTNISIDMLRWLEKTGYIKTLNVKGKMITFMNDIKAYIEMHALDYEGHSVINNFKNSAVNPYIHFNNGAVKINKEGIEYYSRKDHPISFFREKFPLACLNFEVKESHITKVDPEKDFPAFYYYVKELIPKDYMAKITDKKRKKEVIDKTLIFMGQILAYSMSPQKPNEYFFGVYGDEGTGKSFLISIIKKFVGSEFCVERGIEQMKDNKYASASLYGKKVYIDPDMTARKPLPDGFIKSYSGQLEADIEPKFQNSISGVKMSIAMFFVSNYQFITKGLEGIARRFIAVPYKNKIGKSDKNLLDKITGEVKKGKESGDYEGKQFDERPGMFGLAMISWKKFCENNCNFIVPEWVQTEKDIWKREASTVNSFMHDTYIEPNKEDSICRNQLYRDYVSFCEEDDKKPYGKKNFYEEIRRFDNVKEITLGGARHFKIRAQEDEIPF